MTDEPEYGSQIYLVVEAGASAADRLSAILQATEVASILIRPPGEHTLEAQVAKPLVDLAQARGVAALIENDAALARVLRADGVHLAWSDDIAARYEEAREILGTRFIVGAQAGKSRHDAMLLGEAGADYIAFGAPAALKDQDNAKKRRDELVGWWSEIFEIPCVAMDIDSPEAAVALAALHADFLAIDMPRALPPAEAGAHVARIAEAIAGIQGAAPP